MPGHDVRRALYSASRRRQVGVGEDAIGTALGPLPLPLVDDLAQGGQRRVVLRVVQHGDHQVRRPLGLQAVGLAPERELDVSLGVATGASPSGPGIREQRGRPRLIGGERQERGDDQDGGELGSRLRSIGRTPPAAQGTAEMQRGFPLGQGTNPARASSGWLRAGPPQE